MLYHIRIYIYLYNDGETADVVVTKHDGQKHMRHFHLSSIALCRCAIYNNY